MDETPRNEQGDRTAQCSIPAASTDSLNDSAKPRGRGAGKGAGRQSYVYFIQAGEDGPIKIGTTREPTTRLYALQTASPVKLRLVGQIHGDRLEEETLHARLRADRIEGGEWFRPTPAVLAVCAEAERQMLAAEAEAHRLWRSMPRVSPELIDAQPQRPAPKPSKPARVARTRKPAEERAPMRTPRYASARDWLAAHRGQAS